MKKKERKKKEHPRHQHTSRSKVSGQRLETVTSFQFKYLGSIITGEGSKLEILLARSEQTTATLTRLKLICNDSYIN